MNSWSRLCWPSLTSNLSPNFLLVPEFPESRRAVGLDAARRLQGVEVGRAEIAAVDLQRAGVEQPAVPAERALRIHLQRRGGQAVVFEALADAASDIAEHFAVLDDAERHAVFGQERPQAPHVAEQVRATGGRGQEAERRNGDPSARRGRRRARRLLRRRLRTRRDGGAPDRHRHGFAGRRGIGMGGEDADDRKSAGKTDRTAAPPRHRRFSSADPATE